MECCWHQNDQDQASRHLRFSNKGTSQVTVSSSEAMYSVCVCVCVCVCVRVHVHTHVQSCLTLWHPNDASLLGVLSMEFSRQDSWSWIFQTRILELSAVSLSGGYSWSRIELTSFVFLALAGGFFTSVPLGKPHIIVSHDRYFKSQANGVFIGYDSENQFPISCWHYWLLFYL